MSLTVLLGCHSPSSSTTATEHSQQRSETLISTIYLHLELIGLSYTDFTFFVLLIFSFFTFLHGKFPFSFTWHFQQTFSTLLPNCILFYFRLRYFLFSYFYQNFTSFLHLFGQLLLNCATPPV